jgi:hypothetical protein
MIFALPTSAPSCRRYKPAPPVLSIRALAEAKQKRRRRRERRSCGVSAHPGAHANSIAATYRIPVSGALGTAPPQNLNARPLVGARSCRSMHTAACLQDKLGAFVE